MHDTQFHMVLGDAQDTEINEGEGWGWNTRGWGGDTTSDIGGGQQHTVIHSRALLQLYPSKILISECPYTHPTPTPTPTPTPSLAKVSTVQLHIHLSLSLCASSLLPHVSPCTLLFSPMGVHLRSSAPTSYRSLAFIKIPIFALEWHLLFT